MARIADITMTTVLFSLLPVGTVYHNDFGHYFFYIFTGYRRNRWLTLTEPFGSADPVECVTEITSVRSRAAAEH